MPQETNLNVSPYFDDFNEEKNFKRVLFKPGSPVQARELTQLQTILQNQMEKFGQHFFKEGSMVIPGQIGYDNQYFAIQLEDTFLGIPLSEYLDKLVGKKIIGQTSGVEAKVVNYLLSTKSDKGKYTLYIKYTKSGNDFVSNVFNDGENLVATTDIEYLDSRVIANNPFATTISVNASDIGCAASIQEGIYFIRGYFVKVSSQTVIVDQYSNKGSGRIGLFLEENIVNAFEDASLFDNAAGFSNFAAPGADRFQLKPTLIKKDVDVFDDANFIELLRIRKGNIEKHVKKTDYNLIRHEFARRTYDESGNYYVKSFSVQSRESLNDRQGNNGVYFDNQKTSEGNQPSEDKMIYQVGPGKAYVRGYDIEKPGNTFIDIEKPRTIKKLENQVFSFDGVAKIKVNRAWGAPYVGLGVNHKVQLRSQRSGSTQSSAAGSDIGRARVYDYKLEAAGYTGDSSVYELLLWDISLFTTIVVNDPGLTAVEGSLIEGQRTGARGYLRSAASGATSLTLADTSGTFIVDEPIKVNGVVNSLTVTELTEFSIDDVKSIFQDVGDNEFNADTILSREASPAPAGTEYSITTGGTVSVGGSRFKSGVKVGDVVKYQKAGESDPTYNRVSAVAPTGATITIVASAVDVTGVCQKELPSGSTLVTSDFKIVRPRLINAKNSTLISDLPVDSISSVDLSGSEVQVREQKVFNVASNRGSHTLTATDRFFENFDEERYNVAYSDGTIQSLREENLQFSADKKTVTLVGLSKASDTGAVLTYTVKKTELTSQTKTLKRCNKLTISKSRTTGSGASGLVDGLTSSNVYGVRVQDEEISLNVADGVRVLAVFESSTTGDPNLPRLSLINRSTDLTNTVQGEILIGRISGAAGRVVSSTTSTVDIVYTNDIEFNLEEIIDFKSSGITGEVSVVDEGDKLISKNFNFDTGQRSEFYDYARIIRKDNTPDPSKRISIVFDHYIVDGDASDFATVNSYSPENFIGDMTTWNGTVVSDFVDARPRVVDYNISSTITPFDYGSRSFLTASPKPIAIVRDTDIKLTYSHYLARIDKIYLSKEGFFEVKKGSPAPFIDVVPPADPPGTFTVATITNRPFIRNAKKGSRAIVATHKRYTMSDIGRLERRLKNVEYYTQLSLLETDTSSLVIDDAKTGLNRFKSGFFVDNFRSHHAQALGHPCYRAANHAAKGELRPTHYTHGLDLLLGSEQVIGIGTTANPSADLTEVADLQSNDLRRTGDVVTLNYTETEFIKQPFATTTENVNPFSVITWIGNVELNPASDVWLNEKRLDANVVDVEGDYAKTMIHLEVDPNTGLSPQDWGAWEEVWSSTTVNTVQTGSQTSTQFTGSEDIQDGRGDGVTRRNFLDTTTDSFEETTIVDTGLTRSGIQFNVNERIDSQSLGDRVVSSEAIPYMRSRNIEFIGTRVQPRTRFYTFFDGQNLDKYVTPKLIEIEMTSGVFQIGETVDGTVGDSLRNGSGPRISFRTAQPNHKFGSYNNPRIIYDVNPYADNVGLSSNYSGTTSVLNIDTASLQQQVLGDFHGYIAKNMVLTGRTSNAIAKVVDVRLISDEKGAALGSLFIPEATDTSAPEFRTGSKTFRLSSSPVDSRSALDRVSSAETNFRAEGTLDTLQEEIMNIRNAEIQQVDLNDSTTIQSQSTRAFQTQSFDERFTEQVYWSDPLAESIEIVDPNGVFVSSVDVFFQTKDTEIPVTCQIRTMKTGLPTTRIVPFGECTLESNQVGISSFGTVPTKFTFPSPVFLEGGGEEYAIVLMSQSNDYYVFIAVMNEEDLADRDLEVSERRLISTQPYLGSLFKSQNGSTWTPSQFEDLKFTINKCQFVPGPGALKLYNPELGVGELEKPILRPTPLTMNSHEVNIKLQGNSSTATSGWPIGSRLQQTVGSNVSYGNIVAHLGPLATATYQNSTGIGLTPASGTLAYTGIGLTSITGDGTGAVATVTIVGGAVNAISITGGGSGYKAGDVLGASLGETGRNIRFNAGTVSNVNSVILNRVEGDFGTSGALTIVGGAALNNGVPAAVNTVSPEKDGLHFHVKHRNHGMHAANNRVTISGAVGVTTTAKLNVEYPHNSTAAVEVSTVSHLTSFEGLTVSATNPGYVQIGNEVIKYTAVNAGTTPKQLTGITRGIDDTIPETHAINRRVRKYEAAGVSLRRINTTHSFADVDNSLQPTLDGYHIKINTTASGNGITRDGTGGTKKLKFSDTESLGGELVRATQNIQFEAVTPLVEFMTPSDTNITGQIRTVSGTSASGTESSFADQGFEPVSLTGVTYFETPRIIASKINEDTHTTSLPGSKSFTTEYVLTSKDTNVSPMIDLDRLSIITTTNRIDQRTSDYRVDPKINSRFNDPNGAIYITKRVDLENPATSLQVRFGAYRHVSNDIRVLYRLIRLDSPTSESTFELFPGFANLTDTTGDGFGDQVIDAKNNDGRPDKLVGASRSAEEFRDYQFTVNDLVEFHGFQIKVIMAGTNQAKVPRIRDFRTIALA